MLMALVSEKHLSRSSALFSCEFPIQSQSNASIHKRKMPHRGIDYAAAEARQSKRQGMGEVISATRNEASGKFIVLQHGERYTTKYLHLSNFAKNIKRGATVKQGQVIGFVGSTGWATGPIFITNFS